MCSQLGAYDIMPMHSGHKHHDSRQCGIVTMFVHGMHACSGLARYCGEWARLIVAVYTTPTTSAIAMVPMFHHIQAIHLISCMASTCFMTTRMAIARHTTTIVSRHNSTIVTMSLYYSRTCICVRRMRPCNIVPRSARSYRDIGSMAITMAGPNSKLGAIVTCAYVAPTEHRENPLSIALIVRDCIAARHARLDVERSDVNAYRIYTTTCVQR